MNLLYIIPLFLTSAFVEIDFINCETIQDQHDTPVFVDRTKPPGLKDPAKLWWAKEITPNFHVCGRLSERQIKYAADGGFKSILSLFTYPSGDPGGSFGGDYLPNTGEEREIVENIDGMQFVNVLDPMDEWASVDAIRKFTAVAQNLKTPALLRCDRGYTITFVTLLYFINQTIHNPNFEPKFTVKDFFRVTSSMGLDFDQRIPMETLEIVAGRPITPEDKVYPQEFYEPEDWLDYWFAHAVYKNWFTAGQIYKTHLEPLKEFGYKSVINLRRGLSYNGQPSQEDVNLLNVLPNTGTYGSGSKSARQTKERLEETRVDNSRPASYVSRTSTVNYEMSNPLEFGDAIGYNEELERKQFESSSLSYYHMPMASSDELDQFTDKYMEQLVTIGYDGPVLVHCRSAKRAAHVAVLAAAYQYSLSMSWAVQRLAELGFAISAEKQPLIYNTYRRWLPAHTEL